MPAHGDDGGPGAAAWPAPAKLNLFLHIVGRRADGYHRLQTLFQFLDYGDALRFRVRDDGRISRRAPLAGVEEAADLTLRAARLLQKAAGTELGVEIALDKRLPAGGGLGGGSSDAATTLVALNALWGTGLDRGQLAALALELGADVPVFVGGQAAWAEGVGEQLTAVSLPEPWYVVVAPAVTVSTAGIFSDPQLTRDSAQITISDFLAHGGRNDCEPVVRRRYPAVAQALDWLGRHGNARLTGTGGCVFAAFDGRAEAEAVHEALPPRWTGFVARGRNRSPLLDRLAAAE
ncbi:MAG TPA: 4-(cytidine 5'-diphospho)-2-C-methyl-D-erythritol kinase [Gammaproteobacteria bacterium]|nr:4-(cytidine 5'-diphospho)-2-C-methyl-D-erythritol kinase [Gammaproteobacteria bacterium]